jgi:hypothetical protein
MKPDEVEQKKYESALQLLFYEGQIAWQMNVVFIATNVGVITLIGLLPKLNHGIFDDIVYCFGGLIGVLFSIIWLGSFNRNNKYYHFRMAQARSAEPDGWKLLKEDGYKFSKGAKITYKEDNIDFHDIDHQLSKFEKYASNKIAMKMIILVCIIGYSLIFLYFFAAILCQTRICP